MTVEIAKIKERIEGSLKIHSKPTDKEFWYGFLVGLVDYYVISNKEYVTLRDLVASWRSDADKKKIPRAREKDTIEDLHADDMLTSGKPWH